MNTPSPLSEAGEFRLECIGVRQETHVAKTYLFAHPAGQFRFNPGQFLNFVFEIDGEEHIRSYSLSSSALNAENVSVTVKRVQGGRVSNWLFEHMRPGLQVRASGPMGQFSCGLEPETPLLLLTAGSGITPAASMLQSLADKASTCDVLLVHFASSAQDMIFREHMRRWVEALPGLRIVPVVTRHIPGAGWIGPVARLSSDLLRALAPDVAQRHVYCCGPGGFMDLATLMLKQMGHPPDGVFIESFESAREDDNIGSAAEAGSAQFTVTFAKAGLTASVDAETTVLKAAKVAGARIQTSCGKGVCGTCRVRMLSGTVEMKHQGGIRQREIDQGFILACCSRPTSDVVIEK
ncbi:flavin reductase family protein [Rhizobium miluonense]|uniref:Ferredoxin-NADP reductase n=1 Tax=Rhizobium miluonense TaxID=411945 RepID=A0A1C3V8F5_9HYPH|nr:iron-sulfur cluster-binding domain-containing protein [Rhizobium miluonense]SCB23864.1 Ferredoxin-NADP reductase [Rhizobium miluonense]